MKTFKEFVNEAKFDKTANDLKVGGTYTFKDEGGDTFKAKVNDIRKSNGKINVKYEYLDDTYNTKGKSDEFEVSDSEKVFK